jgi:hypothetical protein
LACPDIENTNRNIQATNAKAVLKEKNAKAVSPFLIKSNLNKVLIIL